MSRIISFSGRKKCGKTLLSLICVKYNYELINFADALKDLTCDVLNITREYLEKHKDIIVKNKNNYFDISNKIKYISDEICIDEEIVTKFLLPLGPFNSIRTILQIIGTDLIRHYNSNWHVNKVKTKILNNPTKNYCIGDTRFKNEKQMIEELHGECWFIIRPSMFDISNHASEIDLKWTDFGHNIIINNINKTILTKRWNNYMNYMNCMDYTNFKKLRILLCDLLEFLSINQIVEELNSYGILRNSYKSSCIIKLINNLMLHKFQYKYDMFVNINEITNISITHDNYNSTLHLKAELNDDSKDITCPFTIENLKLKLD